MEARNLRVSDAEREHVGELLQKAVGQGMLSLGEFTERMDTALAAKTRGELNAVLADLPGITLISDYEPPAYPASAGQPGYQYPAPGYQPPVHQPPQYPQPQPYAAQSAPASGAYGAANAAIIRGRMATVTRNGAWIVPPAVVIDTRMSSVTVDFTRAVMQTQIVHVSINDYASSISLIVPEEATVDMNDIEAIGGSASNKVRSGPQMGPLHIVVHGKVRFGSVTAKHPFGTTFRKFMGS
ncbi:DUF1707 domain-containing protein [Rhodococcus sp. NPDC056743]|jgi:hypothetical protein|uniref:DUF1707 SHOCT-like domain-containing protein n=1 Tax=unclassified Rhodococcus (in: high G+C Gram-positive bacteria) TaxID=192944 RepID=UPI00110F4B19|nr:DUF1707 domain-containing protein [Rhodococcus sp. KBS0724]TSD49119.1 DUF1707 domain-containing protein [Rhodococcus sp. KBS0724]